MAATVALHGTRPFQMITGSDRKENDLTNFSGGNGSVFFENTYVSSNHQADLFDIMASDTMSAFSRAHGDFQVSSFSVPSTGSSTVMSVTLDVTAPTAVSFSPADGSARASVGTNMTITFSESVMAGTGSIEIHAGSATGTLVESFDVATSTNLTFSGNTLTINPTADLGYGTDYYVTLVSGSVLDLAGNSYAGTSTWDFMTQVSGSTWSAVSGHGLLNIDAMLEIATGASISDAPLYGDGNGTWDWGLNRVQAPDAWQAGYTGEGIIVAVVDSGVQYTHTDLADNIWMNTAEVASNGLDDDGNGYIDDIYGYDFVNHDGYALDDYGHGTHVAGIIAGLQNGTGVTGVAYEATIMPVKVLGSTGGGTYSNVAYGIMYAVNNGADVINLSIGAYGGSSSAVTSAITYAINHGVIVSMASGNNAKPNPAYPAILAKTVGGIAVGATDINNNVASFSNSAGGTVPYDYVEAPGVNIYSTFNNGGYVAKNGTSMASPYVAGAAALLLSAEDDFASEWSLEQLESIITTTATSLGGTLLMSTSTSTSTTLMAASTDGSNAEIDNGSMGIFEEVELTGVLTGLMSEYEMFAV